MRQIFKIFFTAEGTNPWLVLACLLLGGFAEAIGIGTMLPLLTSVLDPQKNNPSQLEKIIDQVFNWLGLSASFGNTILLILSILLVRSLLLFFAMSYASITAAKVSVGFRRRLVNAIMEARWSYYANQSIGEIATNVGNDASRAGTAYLNFATAAACTMQILAYAVIALLINWKIASAGILGGLLIALLSAKLVYITKRAGFKSTDRVRQLTSELVDMISNIKALKSMHRYGPILAHVDHVITRLRKSMYTQSFARYGLAYGNDFLVALLVAGGAYFAFVALGIPLPELLVVGLVFFQVISYAAKLQKQIQTAAEYQGAYIRLDESTKLAIREKEEISGTVSPDIGHSIEFENVSFSHVAKSVLRNLTISVPANKITVIQGPSGAGKTTLIDLLVGFHRPQQGSIRIGEHSLTTIDLIKWRRSIGYVPQELALFHDSVKANITLYDESITQAALDDAVSLSGVTEFLSGLPQGLDTDVGELGSKLSGGQRQRIALARALVAKPKLLILDEVTSALDPDNEDAIVANIAALRGRYTIIAITHRPAWTRIADYLYTLHDGKAVAQKFQK
jgi:ATP-binding cassette subfamily C protein